MRIRLGSTRSRSMEVRDPSAATKSLGYTSPGRGQISEWDAQQAYRYAYLANVVVYRCATVISQSLAGLPFRVGQDADKPQDFNPNAPMARMFAPPPGGPAPYISAQMLLAWSVVQRIVSGRMAWEIEYGDSGKPVAFWPLISGHLKPIPSQGGVNYFSGFEYGSGKNVKTLNTEQVFYHWRPSQHDWRQPESELQAARLDISVAVMQDRYDYAFLRNDARPAAVVVHEEFDSDESYQSFKEQFLAEHRGPDQAGKMAFVEAVGNEDGGVMGAIDIKQLGLSQKDAEFIKRYELKLRNIAIALGVPFSVLDASGRTFDNASAEWVNFWTITMKPLCQEVAQAMTMQLSPKFGDDLVGWFDLSEVEALKPKPKFQNYNAVQLIDEKVVSKDEVREDLGLAPLPGGMGEMDDSEPAPPPAQLIPLPTLNQDAASAEEPLSVAVSKPKPEVREVDHEQRRAKIWSNFDGQAKTLERSWQRALKGLFKRQLASTLSRLEGKRGRQMITDYDPDTRAMQAREVFDPAFWEDETSETVAGLYEAVFAAGGARIAGQFGIAFDIEAPYVADYIQARANKLAGEVTATTYDTIKDQLIEGVAAGESVPDLAKRVRHVFDVASTARAKTIARTEVIGTYNGSATLVAETLGTDVIAGQEWIAARDERTRDEHTDADGQVTAIGTPFRVGGEELAYPGDPNGSPGNVINCRCTIGMLTPEEMKERAGKRFDVRKAQIVLARVALGKVTPEGVLPALESVR